MTLPVETLKSVPRGKAVWNADGGFVSVLLTHLFHFVSLGVRLQYDTIQFSGLITERGQNKPQIWNPRPQFAYSLYNFYKATMTIKGTLLLNTPLLSVQSKKN